jgi:BCD family chlorophyll transporter-like MFS transporter
MNLALATRRAWMRVAPRFLPFADAASADLPLGRLLRLSLFQVSVGMATVLLIGTLNRVMIVELGVGAWLVAAMVATPLIVAPFRALIGFKSDHHASAIGWRRVPYIWMGSLLQFGGLAIMPFALLVLSGDAENGPVWAGQAAAAIAFLATGAGMQIVQTAGLALATDLAPEASRPRVVALMYVMLLVGMLASGFALGQLLADFSALRLIQTIQGAAVVVIVLNTVALWKQEARDPRRGRARAPAPAFRDGWATFVAGARVKRFLVALGLGTAAFNMQDIVLEPYGGEVLRLSVGATTALTALLAAGALAAFALAARALGRGADPCKVAAYGALAGLPAFTAVILAAPTDSPALFYAGVVLVGFGGGLFSVGTLMAAMGFEGEGSAGLALGAWGAVQATCAGAAIFLGGAIRDLVGWLGAQGLIGPPMAGPAAGYIAVYHLELLLLFLTLAAIGPLVTHKERAPSSKFGLAELPG